MVSGGSCARARGGDLRHAVARVEGVSPGVALCCVAVRGGLAGAVACGVEGVGDGLGGGVGSFRFIGGGVDEAVVVVIQVADGLAGSRVDAAGRKGVRLPGAVAVLVVNVGGGLKGCALGVGDVAWALRGVVGGGGGDAIGIGDLGGQVGAVVGDGDGPACGGDAHFAVEYVVTITRA